MAAESAVQAHHDNPAIAYRQLANAKEALHAWAEAHRELYDAEVARRRAEEQARRDSVRVDVWM